MISRILRQIASLGVAEIVGRLFTFGFSALVARTAGIEVLGYLSLALALITYVTIAGDSGLNQDSTRRLIRGESPKQIVQESVRIQVSVAFMASIIIVLVAYFMYGYPVWEYVLLLVPVPIAMSMATPYLLDYVSRIRPLVISRLVQTVSVGVVGILLILIGVRGAGIAIAYGVGAILSALFVILVARAPYRSTLKRVERGRLAERLIALRRLGLTGVLLHVFVSLPLTVAGFMGGEELAEMGLVSRIWFLISAPAAMAGTVLLPVMSRRDGRNRVWVMCLLGFGLGFVAALVVLITRHWTLVGLFGADAAVAASALAVFSFALPAYGVVAVTSAYLVAIHRERAISMSYGVSTGFYLFSAWVADLSDVSSPLSVAWLVSSCVLAFVLTIAVREERRRIEGWRKYVTAKLRISDVNALRNAAF